MLRRSLGRRIICGRVLLTALFASLEIGAQRFSEALFLNADLDGVGHGRSRLFDCDGGYSKGANTALALINARFCAILQCVEKSIDCG